MASAKQASELAAGDEAYQRIIQEPLPAAPAASKELPLDLLDPFQTADIGFKPYPEQKLKAFAGQLEAEGLLVNIIVRSKAGGRYEILAGHNRANAARMAGWTTIASEIVEADDARAIVIATSTNLIQRQELSIVERGKAYKALLNAKSRQGYRSDLAPLGTSGDFQLKSDGASGHGTSGDNQPKYSAWALVAEFFGVTEYEIRKLVKLTNLVPELLNIIEDDPRRLNLAPAIIMADYDQESQNAFAAICMDYAKPVNKAIMQYIVKKCPPPAADRQDIFAAWREAYANEQQRKGMPPKHITFSRKRFSPYLDKIGSDAKLEELFLEFLRERVG